MRILEKFPNNQNFEFNILLLKFLGLWPPAGGTSKTPWDRTRDVAIGLFVVSGLLISVILLPLGAIKSRDNLGAVIECIGVDLFHFTIAIRVGCIYLRADSVKELTTCLVRLKRRAIVDNQNEGRLKIVANIRIWSKVIVGIIISGLVLFVSNMVVHISGLFVNRRFVARVWLPFDQCESPAYEIIFFLWAMIILFYSAAPSTIDGLIAAMLVDIYGQLNLLIHDLTQIREDAVDRVRRNRYLHNTEDEGTGKKGLGALACKALANIGPHKEVEVLDMLGDEKEEVDKEMSRLLGECVVRFQECARIIHVGEMAFAPIIVTSIISTVILILVAILFAGVKPAAFYGVVDAVLTEEQRAAHQALTLLIVGLVFAICMEFAALCALVDMIAGRSEQLRDAVYSCDWFVASEGFKRSMRILMSRCNQPLVIRAAGFLPLTLETFLRTMNLAYSYYTTITTMV